MQPSGVTVFVPWSILWCRSIKLAVEPGVADDVAPGVSGDAQGVGQVTPGEV